MKQISLKKNFIMNIILTMSSFIFPLITFPYASRALGPTGTGKVSFAVSVVNYFSMFAQLGIPTYGIRICAQIRDNKMELSRTAQELLIINLLTSLLSTGALAILVPIVPTFAAEKSMYCIVGATIVLNAIGMDWLYRALEQYTYITIRSIIAKVIAIIIMFLLVHSEADYVAYSGVTIFAMSASNILNFVNVHKYISVHKTGNYDFKRHIKPILIFFAMSCAITIYTNLDIVMLGAMRTSADVGYYNAAIKIKNILVSVVTSLGAVLLPRASYYVEHKMINEFLRISNKALSFVIMVSIPMMLYFSLFAKESIQFLSGDLYTGAILPMQIIMPTLLFIGMTNIIGTQVLVPLGQEKIVLFSTVAGALADVVINALLIPRFASAGAAIGTVVAEFIVYIVQFLWLKKLNLQIIRNGHYVRFVIAAFLSTVGSILIKKLAINCFAKLCLSSILYFGIYFIYLLIRKEEIVVNICSVLISKLNKCRKN